MFQKLLLIILITGSFFQSALAQNPLAIPPALSGPVINLTMQTSSVNFYPGTATQTMGFSGDILGPTLMLVKNDSVTINVTNNLADTTTVHWHGMHVSPENDGGPHSYIPAGDTWTKKIKVLDDAATYWYHPHMHMHTNEHTIKGLAGFIFTTDATEQSLTLPRTYGTDDFPIVVQTRDFDASNQFLIGTALDTAILVNGTLDPYLDLPAQVVRLRLLNGSSERVYNFGFSNNMTFQMIASDGGLLSAPVSMTRLRLAPGERAEILLDLQGSLGQNFTLMSYASGLASGVYGAAQPGMGPGQTIPNYTLNPLNGADYDILQINVVAQTGSPVTTIPSTLATVTPWLEANADTTRTITFSNANPGPTAIQGPFYLNGTFFDMDVINEVIPLGNTEVWSLTNNTPISHPFHIHDVQFYILDKGGSAPPVHEQGRKDVVLVEPMQTVRFITRFEDFTSDTMPYMYHCHMLTHEDDGMMHQFLVVDTLGTGLLEPSFSDNDLMVFPNPATTDDFKILLRNWKGETISVRLFDLTGRLVYENMLYNEGKAIQIDIPGMNAGQYILDVAGENFRISKKLLRIE